MAWVFWVLWGCAADPVPTEAGPCGLWFPDQDRDGFGDGTQPVEVCAPAYPDLGLITRDGDCNDADPTVHPEAFELCDADHVDEDCNGFANDEDPDLADGVFAWPDRDGDGYGDTDYAPSLFCEVPSDRAARGGDCDDADPYTHRGAALYEGPGLCTTDVDGDGWGSTLVSGAAVVGMDCNDQDADVFPGAKERLEDGIDQDCNELDDLFVYDGFESDVSDIVGGYAQSVVVTDLSGNHVLRMGASGELELRTFSTDVNPDTLLGCKGLAFRFAIQGLALTDADALMLQVWDQGAFREIWRQQGTTNLPEDGTFQDVGVALIDEQYYRADLSARVVVTSGLASNAAFLLDELQLACTGVDGDGDGFGPRKEGDCYDGDARFWVNCGCPDEDGDGYGLGCDLGPDCDDSNPERAVDCSPKI